MVVVPRNKLSGSFRKIKTKLPVEMEQLRNLNDELVNVEFKTNYGEAKFADLLKAFEEVQKRKQARKEYLKTDAGKKYNRDKAKAFYERHKEEILAKRKERYETDRETILNRSKQYYETHKDEIKAKKNKA